MTPEQEKGIMQAFDSYCKTVLRNRARNLHKELDRKERFETVMDVSAQEIDRPMQYWDQYDLSMPVSLGKPEKEMKVSDPQLVEALYHLLPRFREVLFLSYFLQYSDKEISDLLGESTSTITSRRNRTLKKLKNLMGEKTDE